MLPLAIVYQGQAPNVNELQSFPAVVEGACNASHGGHETLHAAAVAGFHISEPMSSSPDKRPSCDAHGMPLLLRGSALVLSAHQAQVAAAAT